MHADAYSFVERAARQHAAAGPVYEIGSRNINGSVRPIFAGLPYHGVDRVHGYDVDATADAVTYAPPDVPSTVVCCEVLEHAAHAKAIVTQACDVLAPGGLLIITVATTGRAPHSAVDGGQLQGGEWYQNVTEDELLAWITASGLLLLESQDWRDRGDLYAVARKAAV